jgi:hypothetical protein
VWRRPEFALAVLAFGVSAYFFQAGGWNQNSRFALTRAVVEGRTFVIDDYVFHTGDYSVLRGHIYCDKAPGVSLLAVPVWAAVRPWVDGPRVPGRIVHLGAYLATLLVIGLPSAIGVAMLFRVARSWGAPTSAAAALAAAYAFATQALPFSTLFYSHQLVAALYLIALGLLVEARDRGTASARRLAVVGLLLAVAITSEYPSVLGAAALTVYAATFVRPWRRIFWFAAGAALPLVLLAAYHTVVFGSPVATGYSSTVSPGRSPGLLPGMTLPDPSIVPRILFGEERGLVRHAPWLALALPGLVGLLMSRARRADGLLCLSFVLMYLALNAAQTRTPDDWRGGASIGARYLVPSVPFYALALVGLVVPPLASFRRARPVRWAATAVFAGLVALSAARMVAGTAVHAEPNKKDNPFRDHIFPLWREDKVAVSTVPFHAGNNDPKYAWNLGEKLFGLAGRRSLLPLAVFAAFGAAGLAAAVREEARRERNG